MRTTQMVKSKALLVAKIKQVSEEIIHHPARLPSGKISEYLSNSLSYDYTYLANIFSKLTGTTIEQYIIQQKIRRVKELLLYSSLTLTQISIRLHYSSVAHLSGQFKKVTGATATFFLSHTSDQYMDEL